MTNEKYFTQKSHVISEKENMNIRARDDGYCNSVRKVSWIIPLGGLHFLSTTLLSAEDYSAELGRFFRSSEGCDAILGEIVGDPSGQESGRSVAVAGAMSDDV